MRTIDLFCGCGGMSLGFQEAGFELVAAYDHWQPALKVYRQNFSHPAHCVNLSQFTSYDELKTFNAQLIIGGPPCQDFSSAGKRNENLGRADLTVVFANLVAAVQPQWFVMENVERILKSDTLQKAKAIFKAAHYGLSQVVLDASLCGVPQKRKRFFMVGELGGIDQAVLPSLLKHQASTPMTVHAYMGAALEIEYYYRHPRSYLRRAIYSIYEPSPTIRGVNRPIPATYKMHPHDATPPSSQVRALTTLERSYLQTFPKEFLFEGSKSDVEQMIGNAVPVKLASFVARGILDYIQQDKAALPHPSIAQLQLL